MTIPSFSSPPLEAPERRGDGTGKLGARIKGVVGQLGVWGWCQAS